MFSYIQKKILATILVVTIIAPAVFLAQPKKAEAACSFGGGGSVDPNNPGASSGVIKAFESNKSDFIKKLNLQKPVPFSIKLLTEKTPLAVNAPNNIFKSAGGGATLPQTNFDARNLDNGVHLAAVATQGNQLIEEAIAIATQAIECITSIVNLVTSGATSALVVKEYVLDGIAYAVVNQIIADMLNDIKRWAVSGFKGSPVFLTDPGRYFSNLADDVLGTFLNGLAGVNLCNVKWKPLIEIALDINIGYRKRAECSFSKIGENFEKFTNDFTQGGWGAWIKLTTQSQNNPYGAYLLAVDEVARKIGVGPQGALGIQTQKFIWSRGIIGITKCERQSDDGVCKNANGDDDPTATITVTPGNIIEEQLNSAFGMPNQRIVAADEIDEVITSLLYGLLVKTFSSDEGLLGADWSNLSQQVGGGKGNTAFDNIKKKMTADVDGFTKSETDYKSRKEASLAVLKDGENALNGLAGCYIDELALYKQYLDPANTRLRSIVSGNPFLQFVQADAEKKLQDTRDILAQKITPRVAPLQNTVTQSNVFLFEIRETREAFISSKDFTGLDMLVKNFLEISSKRWHNPINAGEADNEFEAVKREVNPIVEQAKIDLTACSATRQQMRDFFKLNDVTPAA